MKNYIVVYLLFINCFSYAQLKNTNWCFGDSSGINFSSGNPVPFAVGMDGRGSCVSISDSLGQLLFYAATRAGISGNSGRVYNRNHSLMQNGDSIIGEGWYQEMLAINSPDHNNLYYLFSTGVTGSSQYGLYYSVIDMNLDSGQGGVLQKNIQLSNLAARDGINAIKHANGRDWWLIFRNWQTFNNDFFIYLVTPDNIYLYPIQSEGEILSSNVSFIQFNKVGNQILIVDWTGLIELFDFDRCTGIISLNQVIEYETANYPYYFGCEFSPNGRFAYVVSEDYNSSFTDTSHLYQFDLNATNVAASKSIIKKFTLPESPGELKLAPDGKIYLASNYMNFMSGYPYPDSIRNYIVENLSVINAPDSLGSACNFTPFSFYLGGKRTYIGLPNNPDYELAPVSGSVCDTLTDIGIIELTTLNDIAVFPSPFYNKISFHPFNSSSAKISITIFNNVGEKIFEKETVMKDQEIDLSKLTRGVYLLNVKGEMFSVTKKIVKM